MTDWFLLGVDSSIYPCVTKTKNLNKFCVGVYTESLVRGGVELCLEAFCKTFQKHEAKLLIKDRNATPVFEKWVKDRRDHYDADIEYLNCHFSSTDQIIDWFSGVDIHLYLNRSSTFAMPPAESACMGIPTIAMSYSGPREFIFDRNTGMNPKYTLEYIDKDFGRLLNIGTRNFFFWEDYLKRPVWAVPDMDSVGECMTELRNNKVLFNDISVNGTKFMKGINWENSAESLYLKVNKFHDR